MPSKAALETFLSVIPKWIRFVVIGLTFFAALYWSVVHDFALLDDYRLGFLVVWIGLLLPTVAVFYGLAWWLNRRRRKQDFPRAIVRR